MTFPLLAFLFGAMLIYVGIKGYKLGPALLGHAVPGSSGSLLGGVSTATPGAASPTTTGQIVGGYTPGGAIQT